VGKFVEIGKGTDMDKLEHVKFTGQGSDGKFKCVAVKSVDVVTKDTAPFPIEQCKKVLEVIPEERIKF
jgi:hypothetical protein